MANGIRFFESLQREKTKTALEKKGRNADFIECRNKVLFYRYYYYQSLRCVRYNDIINKLSDEFFLSERRITDIIYSNTDKVKAICAEKPTYKQLAQLFPSYNWKATDLIIIK